MVVEEGDGGVGGERRHCDGWCGELDGDVIVVWWEEAGRWKRVCLLTELLWKGVFYVD